MTNDSTTSTPSSTPPNASRPASADTATATTQPPAADPAPPIRRPWNYPLEFEHEVVSAGDLHYRLRPIRPDDAERLVQFHNRLSPHSCYLRFFTLHPTLSPKEVEHFTTVDYHDRFALVGERDGTLIAVGRFDRDTGTSEAEVAFVVADEYQHHGIGSLLLDELVGAASQRGITTFLADTLVENHAMLDVFLHAGFAVQTHTEYGTVSLRFDITPTEAYRRARATRDQSRQLTPTCPLLEITGVPPC